MTHPFPPLAVDTAPDGTPRRTGVEIEFAGLSVEQAAKVVARSAGGTARNTGPHAWCVDGTSIGDVQVYLDTALRHAGHRALREAGLSLGRDLIPVEIVTEPLTRDGLSLLDRIREDLAAAGAEGSRSGLFYGFGVHLNVGIASEDARGITRPLLAWGLIEDWMRQALPIDNLRRILPFTDPWPTDLVHDLCKAGVDAAPETVMEIYLRQAPNRNYGLDALPLLAHLDADAVRAAIGGGKALKARPAFHFRLPDSRIDQPEWSLTTEWRRWQLVEEVAARRSLLNRLCAAWLADHGPITLIRRNWARRASDILGDAGIIPADEAA